MPGSLTIPNDQTATVPLIFRDAAGVVHAPPDGGSVTVSDPAVASAAVGAGDGSVVITPIADGQCTVGYSNTAGGGIADTLSVTIAEPTPTSVALDPADAVFAAKP